MTAALAANPTQRYRWVILLIATFAQACACFFVQGIGAIAVFIQNDLQLSSLQIGLLVSAAQLVPIVGLLVAGELLDRYSERLVVGLGTLIVALALCASLWATDYLTILLFLVVVGAGYSTAQPGGSKSVSRWFAKTQLGFAMGIRQAGLPLGGALSAALLPYLAGIYGWRSAFLAGGLVAFLGALAFMLFYRTPPDAPAPGANPAERDLGAVVKSRLAMITDPAMKNIVCSGVALISVQYGILVFTVLYLHETLEIGIGMAATLLFVAQGSGVAGRILLAAWSDRCRAGRYFPVMVCLGAVILGLLALVGHAVQLFLQGSLLLFERIQVALQVGNLILVRLLLLLTLRFFLLGLCNLLLANRLRFLHADIIARLGTGFGAQFGIGAVGCAVAGPPAR